MFLRSPQTKVLGRRRTYKAYPTTKPFGFVGDFAGMNHNLEKDEAKQKLHVLL
jgi:hypothetical protein